MTHVYQLLFVGSVMFLLGILFGYLMLRQNFRIRAQIVNRKNFENMGMIKELYDNQLATKATIATELEDLKIWAADAEIYIEELEVENLALNGTKSRATVTAPEGEIPIKEKKVVHKRTRKAK